MSTSSPSPANPRLSVKAGAVGESVTLEITAKAKALRKAGKDVIAFTAGEPDLPVPPFVQEAGIAAIRNGLGVYTAAAGIPELREAAAARFRSTGIPSETEDVVITSGAKSALYLALFVLLDEGDEAVFPSPYWGSYADMIRAAGGVPVPVPACAAADFQPDAGALASAITPRTRVLILNSPNNPTGTVYSRATLAAIADVLRPRRDIQILSDDIYDSLIYTPEPFLNLAMVAPDLAPRTIAVNSVSKSHSMTGWRVGYATGDRRITGAMARVQSQISGSVPAISQYAALEALRCPADPERVRDLDARRREMVDGLARLPGIQLREPRGAFYAFPCISSWFGYRHGDTPIQDAQTFCNLLLDHCLVAAVSGEAFGVNDHVRLTYTVPREAIREGLRRIGGFLASLTPPG